MSGTHRRPDGDEQSDGAPGGRGGAGRRDAGSAPMLDPRSILTSLREVVYDWRIDTDVLSWGANAAEVLQLPDLEALARGRSFGQLIEPGSGVTRQETVLLSRRLDQGSGVPYRTRYNLRLPGDRRICVEDTGRWFADASGRPITAHGVIRVEDRDPCQGGTGRRSAFIAQIDQEVREAALGPRRVTVLVAAIEGLGRINDELGFESGDMVVAEVARRVGKILRRGDRLVHYAGNRFAVAMMSCPIGQAESAAKRLCDAVSGAPIETSQGPFPVSIRVGAACAPDHADDAAMLVRRAEDALSVARRAAEGRCVVFDPARAVEAQHRRPMRLSAPDVIDALNERRIVFARQPIVCARTRETAFGEALARMFRPAKPHLPAGEIIPAIERAGLVPLLDARMLELATRWLAANPRERLALNLSPMTLESPDWLATLRGHLGAHPGVAERLIVEVTETVAIGDPEGARTRLEAMKELGVAIAIDDFGAGHTSFKHLRAFPVDLLKIDGAFVQNLARSPDDRFFVRTLVDLAHNLGIPVVAEWVEDEETAAMLAGWGVDYLQGEHCGKPQIAVLPAQAHEPPPAAFASASE